MSVSSRLAVLGGAVALAIGVAGSASAMPVASKATIVDGSASSLVEQVRNGGGRNWRGGGWRGGGRWVAPRYAYRGGGRGYWRGGRWYGYGPGWGWGAGAAFAGAAIAGAAIAAPYYGGYGYGGQCRAQVIGPNGLPYWRWVPC